MKYYFARWGFMRHFGKFGTESQLRAVLFGRLSGDQVIRMGNRVTGCFDASEHVT